MELLGHHLLTVDVRPTVAAWLFPTGSSAALRRAVQAASRRWGGMGEPLIPVSPTGRVRPFWRQVLAVLDPDICVAVDIPSDVARRAVGSRQVVSEHAIDHHPIMRCHQLSVADLADVRGHTLFYGEGSLRDEAGAGAVPPDEILEWQSYAALLRSDEGGVAAARSQLERSTILHIGMDEVGEVEASNVTSLPIVLWVCGASSYRDVLWFWNLRALSSRRLWPSRMALVGPDLGKNDRFADVLATIAAQAVPTEPAVVLDSLTLPPGALDDMAKRLDLKPTSAKRMSLPLVGDGTPRDVIDYATHVDLASLVIGPRRYGSRAHVSTAAYRPTTRIDLPLPIRFNHQIGGMVRLRISQLPMTQVPQRESVAQLFHANAYWDSTSALGLVVSPTRHMVFDVKIPTPQDVFTAALQDRGMSWALSNAGVYGQGLLQRVSPEVLGTASVLHVIKALTTPRSKMLAKELRSLPAGTAEARLLEIAGEWGGRAQQTFRTVDELASRLPKMKKRSVGDALEHLSHAGLAERGGTIVCGTCSIRSFVPMERIEAAARCPACGTPATYSRAANGGMAVSYRLNALLDRASDNGVVMHLAGMALLQERPDAHLWPGVDLTSTSGPLGEADVCGYVGTELVLGEAKNSAAEFTREQVKRDVKLVEALSADVYVLIAIGDVDEDVLRFAEKSAQRIGASVEVVTPT